jgi:hypothetical protein
MVFNLGVENGKQIRYYFSNPSIVFRLSDDI